MINKHKDIETNISSSNIDIGDIGCRFYTEDENIAFIRINIKYDGQPVDLTDNEEMKPKLDLFMQDGSIFIDEPLEILIPQSGSMQYNIPNKVIKHAGKVNCKLFLDNGTKSVHVSNFSFTIVDSGVEDVVAKEISVNLVKDTVRKILSEDLTEVLDNGFKEQLTKDLQTYLSDNDSKFKGDKGDKGDTGERGLKGDTGDMGPQGLQGIPGKNGRDGLNGLDGKNGKDGIDGVDGVKGDKGDKGDPFTYEDFTQDQLSALKGEKGDRGLTLKYSDLTEDEKNSLKSAIATQTQSDFKIGNNAIDVDKLNFVVTGKNVFNKSNVVSGRVGSDGNIVSATDVSTSKCTKILPNTTYITNQSIWINEYDNDLKFISYNFIAKGKTFTTNANTSFIRISCGTTNLDVLQVEQGTTSTGYVPFYYALNNVENNEVANARTSVIKNKSFSKIGERFESIETDLNQVKVKSGTNIGTDTQAEQAFVDEMNKKVTQLGGTTKFYNSSGLTVAGQAGNAYDFNIYAIHASVKPELASVWGQKSYSLNIKGTNARTVSVDTTVTSPTLENYYTILGGKTGTAGIIHNLTAIVTDGNNVYVGTVMRGTDDRFNDLKQAIEQAINKDKGLAYDVSLVGNSDTAFSVVKYPTINPLLTTNYKPQILLSKNETVKNNPASMTKIVTSIVMLENATNLNQTITFQDSDLVGGSGVEIKAGDIITLRDALYTMMLSSSNNTAKAVARVVGHNIINTRGYV